MNIIRDYCYPVVHETVTGMEYDPKTLALRELRRITTVLPVYKDRLLHTALLNSVMKALLVDDFLLANKALAARWQHDISVAAVFLPSVYSPQLQEVRSCSMDEALAGAYPTAYGIVVNYKAAGELQEYNPAWCEKHRAAHADNCVTANAIDSPQTLPAWRRLFEEFLGYLNIAPKNPGDQALVMEYSEEILLLKGENSIWSGKWRFIMGNIVAVEFFITTQNYDLRDALLGK